MMAFIVGLLAGIVGAMGLGGGSVLMIYLTLFLSLPQFEAQGINLIFFIPCAAVAVFFHKKNRLIPKGIWRLIITGLIGAAGGFALSEVIGEDAIRKIFAALLLIMGLREIFCKAKK